MSHGFVPDLFLGKEGCCDVDYSPMEVLNLVGSQYVFFVDQKGSCWKFTLTSLEALHFFCSRHSL